VWRKSRDGYEPIMSFLQRRLLVAFVLAALVCATNAQAQTATGLRRIYVLAPGFGPQSAEAQAFRTGLRELGYVEETDVAIDWWYGSGSYEGLAAAVADLATRKPDIIVVESTAAAIAAKRATSTIPIVMALVADPVGSGLVASLARPGGNATGLTNQTTELMRKRLHIVREALPKAKRVAVLWNQDTPPHRKALQELEAAAKELQLELRPVQARSEAELGVALATIARMDADALVALDGPFFTANGSTILRAAARARVPVFAGYKPLAPQGILIIYSAPVKDLFHRAAGYVDKILRGASPANLPVEQPTKFELVVNLKAARTLGISIPQSLLLQADEVIQ
jgi:putative ABC transport system substrate-binding protein